ncbi:MAG: RidA family protein [Planctomycetota bacterium]
MPDHTAKPLARYAPYRRAGDLVLMSGIVPMDPEMGRVIRGFEDLPADVCKTIGQTGEASVDLIDGPAFAQSWYVLDKVRSTVEGLGGQMADVIKLVQYFKDLRDFPRYNQVRKLFYPDQPPASTVVEVSGMMPSAEVLIEVEATAYLPQIKDV